MNSKQDVKYRLDLSQGFFKEAEEDFQLKRWRSCVSNAQLSVENSGKALLTLYGITPKTHDPGKHLSRLISENSIPGEIKKMLQSVLPDFLLLGFEEHFMTDYGDETEHKLPWDMFNKSDARNALNTARKCIEAAVQIDRMVSQSRK